MTDSDSVITPEIGKHLQYPTYWNKPFTTWGSVADWDLYYINEMSGASKDEAHKTLGSELKVLLNFLDRSSRVWSKAKAIKKQLRLGKNPATLAIWEEHRVSILKATAENKINENVNKRKIENIARDAVVTVAKTCYTGCDETPKRPRTGMGNHKDQRANISGCAVVPQTSSNSEVQSEEKEEDELYQETVNDTDANHKLLINSICIRSEMENWRKTSKYIQELHKQYLLRYNIIDSVDASSTYSRNLFNKIWVEMTNTIEAILSPSSEILDEDVKDGKADEVKTYSKISLKGVNTFDKICKVLKLERSKLRNNGNVQWKRRVLAIEKAFRDQFKNGRSAFIGDQTEYHYIITFIYPIFNPLFKDLQHIGFVWGEKTLQCSVKLFNEAQKDCER